MANLKLVVVFLLVSCMLFQCFAEIEVKKNSFRVYRQMQKTTQKNYVNLRFKTIHATGLIMLVRGANKKDYLSIELYRGKIRVSGNFANGTTNALRPILGQFDMYAGKDLADNEWHTVEYIRNIRQNIIYLDRGTSKERFVFRKSPETYDELSVSMITFGGYYSFSTGDLKIEQSFSRQGIQACFSVATFSQEWYPLSERSYQPEPKTINFVEAQLPGVTPNPDPNVIPVERMVNVGDIETVLQCTDSKPMYRPIHFKSSAVHIALSPNYTIQNMKMDLKFRTVVNDQTLANITHCHTGESINLRINRKGQVVLQMDQDNQVKIIETAREEFNDNQWHEVSFDIDNQESTEKSYTAKFIVDGKTRFTKLNKRINFDGYINIGFGFTGCMRDIKINDDDIQKVRRSLTDNTATPNYFNVSDVGVRYNVCSIRDFCNPNPCQNGGKCNQTDDNFVCNCVGTLYEGSTCHRPRFNYTCAGVRRAGVRRSDVYYIDFDGMGPMQPVQALCDLGETIETTVTQINNTRYMDVDVSTKSGYNSVDINYGASITQMRELIMNSGSCKQFIKFTCKSAPLFRSPTGPPSVNWMGGDDVAHFYWGGAKDNRGYCRCGVNNDCRVGGKLTGQYCHCDSTDVFSDVKDEGNFTIKEHLPVRAVNFLGNVVKNSGLALLRVGHLRCQGYGFHEISATFRKRYSYLAVFHPDQPFDNIQAGEISFEFKTSVAYNFMTIAHAIGPFSGDYIKIMIWSKTMMRVLLNLGFGDLKQDVDISRTGRTIDDNEWHVFSVMFNQKEMNVTLDGVRMIQGLPLQPYPVFFNSDATPVYIGGSYHSRWGFIGCMRSVYVNGRIFEISKLAVGKEDEGIYPGCGSACPLLNRPCNYGECLDFYDDFKCNCSVSPFGGKFCQNETRPMTFGQGNYISYNFNNMNHTRPVATAKIVLGFKTAQLNVGLAQLTGNDSRHFSLALIDGYPTIFWNMIKKDEFNSGTLEERKTEIIQLTKRRLNNEKHNVIKVSISTRHVTLSVPNYDLSVTGNFTEEPLYNDQKDVVGRKLQEFERLSQITIGRVEDVKMNVGSVQLPLLYTGCMSGAKMVYTPQRTDKDPFPEAREMDFFKMIQEQQQQGSSNNNNEEPLLTGSYPAAITGDNGCGPDLPIPGKLPTVGPPKQFNTKSPGLDNSVRIPETDMVNQLMLVACIIILTALILGFLFLIYKKAISNHKAYQHMHKSEKSRGGGGMQPMKKMMAAPSAKPYKQNLMELEFSPDTNNEKHNSPADDDYL